MFNHIFRRGFVCNISNSKLENLMSKKHDRHLSRWLRSYIEARACSRTPPISPLVRRYGLPWSSGWSRQSTGQNGRTNYLLFSALFFVVSLIGIDCNSIFLTCKNDVWDTKHTHKNSLVICFSIGQFVRKYISFSHYPASAQKHKNIKKFDRFTHMTWHKHY